MAADNKVHVVLINPAGQLVHRQKNFNPEAGSIDLENAVKGNLSVVAVFLVRDLNGDQGGPWWDEYSGNSQLRVAETFEGIAVSKRDFTPPHASTKAYTSDANPPLPATNIDSKLIDSTMGSGANWPVLDDGQGTYYAQKLAEARVLVGYPT
jgi:hypothetical protein